MGEHGWSKILLMTSVVLVSMYLCDLYEFNRITDRVIMWVGIVQAFGLASITLAIIFYTVPNVFVGRGVFAINLVSMLVAVTLLRASKSWASGKQALSERVLVLGAGRGAASLAHEVSSRPNTGYELVGFIGDEAEAAALPQTARLFKSADNLEEIVRGHRVGRVVVALDDRRGQLPLDQLLNLRLRDLVAVEESSSFAERISGKIRIETLRPACLVFSSVPRRIRAYRRIRRILDIVLASAGLAISLPIAAVTALAIKLDSIGPVFYTQERVGEHNTVFKIIKLRSMRTDAEEDGPAWAGVRDPRVTRVGAIIRKLRIDELPQFVNILRGDMSFIGPRPERPVFVEQLEAHTPYYSQRHLIKPGLTGWAQVCYSYGGSVEEAIEKLEYDLYYIKNQSLLLDAIILIETIKIVLFGRGAR
jgi:sugar transferase (PEP-CTERM system associated)